MTAPSTRPLGRMVLLLVLAIIALLAVGAFVRWQGQLRPAGHAQLVITPLAEHPLHPGTFVYELRVQGISRDAGASNELERGRAFRVRTRRGAEWSDVAEVTTAVHPFALASGVARRLPEALTVTELRDRWGNVVDPFTEVSRGKPLDWRGTSGSLPVTWETALGVSDAQPDEVELTGELEAADGSALPFRVSALVPERRITASPAVVLHPDDR